MPQHFMASRADTQISADKATGNTRTKVVHATGNVIVHRTAPIQGTGDSRIGPEPSTLTCDKLDIDGGKKFYVASGNVHFTQGTRDATADRGTLDEVTGLLHLLETSTFATRSSTSTATTSSTTRRRATSARRATP